MFVDPFYRAKPLSNITEVEEPQCNNLLVKFVYISVCQTFGTHRAKGIFENCRLLHRSQSGLRQIGLRKIHVKLERSNGSLRIRGAPVEKQRAIAEYLTLLIDILSMENCFWFQIDVWLESLCSDWNFHKLKINPRPRIHYTIFQSSFPHLFPKGWVKSVQWCKKIQTKLFWF